MDRRALPTFALLALLMLAGCASEPPTAGTQGPASTTAASEHGLTVLRTGPGEAKIHEVWANGTVAYQDSCNTSGCARGRAVSFRATDITTSLPSGVPVRVEAEVVYESHPLYGPAWELTILAPDSALYAYTDEMASGGATAAGTLLPKGTVEILLSIYQPGGGVPDTPYTLRIRITTDPLTLFPGVPVGIDLGPGDNVSADVPFLLFAPDGQRLGRFFKLHNIPDDARAGQYMLVLLPEGPPSPVSGSGGGGLKALALRHEPGPLVTVPQEGVLDQSWDVAGEPLGVGIRIFTQPGASGQNALATMGVSATLAGPNGFGLEVLACGGMCVTVGPIGWDLMWTSPLGDDRITAGTYTLRVDSKGTHEAFAQPFAVYVGGA